MADKSGLATALASRRNSYNTNPYTTIGRAIPSSFTPAPQADVNPWQALAANFLLGLASSGLQTYGGLQAQAEEQQNNKLIADRLKGAYSPEQYQAAIEAMQQDPRTADVGNQLFFDNVQQQQAIELQRAQRNPTPLELFYQRNGGGSPQQPQATLNNTAIGQPDVANPYVATPAPAQPVAATPAGNQPATATPAPATTPGLSELEQLQQKVRQRADQYALSGYDPEAALAQAQKEYAADFDNYGKQQEAAIKEANDAITSGQKLVSMSNELKSVVPMTQSTGPAYGLRSGARNVGQTVLGALGIETPGITATLDAEAALESRVPEIIGEARKLANNTGNPTDSENRLFAGAGPGTGRSKEQNLKLAETAAIRGQRAADFGFFMNSWLKAGKPYQEGKAIWQDYANAYPIVTQGPSGEFRVQDQRPPWQLLLNGPKPNPANYGPNQKDQFLQDYARWKQGK